MRAKRVISASVVVGLVAVSAAAGATPKVTLTVAVSGGGSVSSRPAGVNCKPACKLHAKKGSKVTLTASANDNSEFSHWSAPCGTAYTCTVKMTGARSVHAYFKAIPAPPPPPPPPPMPKSGHYSGTYTDGTFFSFDLSGTVITNVNFDFNGDCSDGGTSYDTGTVLDGPFAVAPDGSFAGTPSITYSNQVDSFTLGGNVNTSGMASGTLKIEIDFNGGPTCTSSGTWTAQDQS